MIKSRKKRKLKKNIKVLFIFIIIGVSLILVLDKKESKKIQVEVVNSESENNDNKNINNTDKNNKITAVTTKESETNFSLVKSYFANGMSVEDYKKTIETSGIYINSTEKYSKIEYNFEKHYHYSDLEKLYTKLNNSEIVKLEVIGKSVDNRKMYSLEIGTGSKKIMFEAGIHAAEMANPLFITKFMIDLVNDYEDGDSSIKELLEEYTIIVLPAANPDGYEVAIYGPGALNNQNLFIASKADPDSTWYNKSNANGVDLNRNFPSQTSGLYYNTYDLHYSVGLEPTTEKYFPGNTLGSEPETRAIMYWQNKHLKNTLVYVALHSRGRVIYNGKPYLSNDYNDLSHEYANIVSNITGYTSFSKLDEEAGEGNDGTSSEYVAETISGFVFSEKTGRLSSDYYAKKINNVEQDTGVIVIETLANYTTKLEVIKSEWYDYSLDKTFKSLIKYR